MHKVELLAPAGDFESLKQAINYGADAIYLGGSNFSARAFATNFDNEKIVEAINYAHLRNVKVYVTINTLLNEFEIDAAYNYAKYLYENNVDGILVQDLGLFYRLRNDFKDLDLHASTQMHIHNLSGVKVAKQLGFKRVVVARESSLDEIKEFCKEGIEIETFVHGAICVSYSGQCLMSSITKDRSANRGMCAQCCRLKYKLYDSNDNQIKTDTEYLLSPKDMYLLENIADLIKAGVTSFKIEGRMKSPAYVGYVTSIYRQAIDNYYQNKEFVINEPIINNLKSLFNRGFTNSYLLNDSNDIFNNKRPNHLGTHIGNVVDIKGEYCFIKLDKDINQFDGIRIINKNNDTGLILNMLEVDDLLVAKAYKGQIVKIKITDTVNINDEVVLTQDKQLEDNIVNSNDKLIPIKLNIKAYPNNKMLINCIYDNNEFIYQSQYCIQEAIKAPISIDNIINSFNAVDSHPYIIDNYNIDIKNIFIPLKILNEIRRDFYNKLDEYRLKSFKRINNNELVLNNLIDQEIKGNLVEYTSINNTLNYNSLINKDNKYYDDDNVVKEVGGLLLEGNKVAYMSLNVTNSYAYEFLIRLGFKDIILSLELNNNQIDELINNYIQRTNKIIYPYVFMYGRRSNMNILRNPFKKYLDNNKKYYLSDGNNKYLINNSTYLELLDYLPYIRENKPNNTQGFYKVIDNTELDKILDK